MTKFGLAACCLAALLVLGAGCATTQDERGSLWPNNRVQVEVRDQRLDQSMMPQLEGRLKRRVERSLSSGPSGRLGPGYHLEVSILEHVAESQKMRVNRRVFPRWSALTILEAVLRDSEGRQTANWVACGRAVSQSLDDRPDARQVAGRSYEQAVDSLLAKMSRHDL